MKHTNFSAGAERRLIHMAGDVPQTPRDLQNLQRLDKVHMAEGNDVIKNRHGYDNVQERIARYLGRFDAARQRMQKMSGTPGFAEQQMSAKRNAINEPVNRTLGLQNMRVLGANQAGDVFVQGQNGATYLGRTELGALRQSGMQHSEVNTYAGNEQMIRIFWDVVALERHYNRAEQIVADLERSAAVPANETLQNELHSVSMGRLAAQMAEQTNDGNKLQTIHLDLYTRPFTARGQGAQADRFHLLRVPQGVTGSFVNTRTGQTWPPLETITLSGGAQYYRIPYTNFNDMQDLRLRLDGADTRPRFGTMKLGYQNNLIFTFADAPPVEQERKIEQSEVDVNSIPPMYTGDPGARSAETPDRHAFRLQATGGNAESQQKALSEMSVQVGTQEVRFNAGGEIRLADGMTFRVVGNRVEVTAGSTRRTERVIFRRNGVAVPGMEREAVVNTIDMSQNLSFNQADVKGGTEKRFTTIPADQQSSTRVYFPRQDTPLAASPDPNNWTPSENGSVQVRQDMAGAIYVRGLKPTDPLPIWFQHTFDAGRSRNRPQAIIQRQISVTVPVPPPPEPVQKLDKVITEIQRKRKMDFPIVNIMVDPEQQRKKKTAQDQSEQQRKKETVDTEEEKKKEDQKKAEEAKKKFEDALDEVQKTIKDQNEKNAAEKKAQEDKKREDDEKRETAAKKKATEDKRQEEVEAEKKLQEKLNQDQNAAKQAAQKKQETEKLLTPIRRMEDEQKQEQQKKKQESAPVSPPEVQGWKPESQKGSLERAQKNLGGLVKQLVSLHNSTYGPGPDARKRHMESLQKTVGEIGQVLDGNMDHRGQLSLQLSQALPALDQEGLVLRGNDYAIYLHGSDLSVVDTRSVPGAGVQESPAGHGPVSQLDGQRPKTLWGAGLALLSNLWKGGDRSLTRPQEGGGNAVSARLQYIGERVGLLASRVTDKNRNAPDVQKISKELYEEVRALSTFGPDAAKSGVDAINKTLGLRGFQIRTNSQGTDWILERV